MKIINSLREKKDKVVGFLLAIFYAGLPSLGFAQIDGGKDFGVKLPKGEPIKVSDVTTLFVNLVNYALAFVTIAAAIALLYSAYLYISPLGKSEDNVKKAKDIAFNAIIGLAIAFGIGIIINTIRFLVVDQNVIKAIPQ